jgi:hypothetical protein
MTEHHEEREEPAERHQLELDINAQPNETTCGPTCLHAVYRYLGDVVSLGEVIAGCSQLEEGGTLAPLLGLHALQRGYAATIYSFNLRVFDPSWFHAGTGVPQVELADKLLRQLEFKEGEKFHTASHAYRDFVREGGRVRMQDLTRPLLRGYLSRRIPILAGVSSTYLYHEMREWGPTFQHDDIRGLPAGHFVVLCGYDRQLKRVRIADPYLANPLAPKQHYYEIPVDRVMCAILLGILTYDANLLVLESKR